MRNTRCSIVLPAFSFPPLHSRRRRYFTTSAPVHFNYNGLHKLGVFELVPCEDYGNGKSSNTAKKEKAGKRTSLNKHAPPQLRESLVGELVDQHEKKLLSDTMNALRYEDLKMKHAKGRDFTGLFVVYNGVRDLLAHSLHYSLGPLGLFVLVPWLGKEICQSKLFLPHPQTKSPYIGSLAMSFTGPNVASIWHLFLYLQDAHQVLLCS